MTNHTNPSQQELPLRETKTLPTMKEQLAKLQADLTQLRKINTSLVRILEAHSWAVDTEVAVAKSVTSRANRTMEYKIAVLEHEIKQLESNKEN